MLSNASRKARGWDGWEAASLAGIRLILASWSRTSRPWRPSGRGQGRKVTVVSGMNSHSPCLSARRMLLSRILKGQKPSMPPTSMRHPGAAGQCVCQRSQKHPPDRLGLKPGQQERNREHHGQGQATHELGGAQERMPLGRDLLRGLGCAVRLVAVHHIRPLGLSKLPGTGVDVLAGPFSQA